MPFCHEDTSVFGPEDLAILHEVFELGWQSLLTMALTAMAISLQRLAAAWRNALWRMPSLRNWMCPCCLNAALLNSIAPC